MFLGIIATLIIFGILVTIHEWGHFIFAKMQGVKVERFSIGFGPVFFRYTWHETEYALSLIPFGGYVKMAGDDPSDKELKGEPWEYLSQTPLQKIKIAIAGPLLNYIFALFLFIVLFWVGIPTATTKIGGMVDGYNAKIAGIKEGDKILKVNGVLVSVWDDMTKEIQDSKTENIELEISRDGAIQNLSVLGKKEEIVDAFGHKKQAFLIGIRPSMDAIINVKHSLGSSIFLGSKKLYDISKLTYFSIWKIITGKLSFKQSMTGPIGIAVVTVKTAQSGFLNLVYLMGMLSAALALFNFLPIPALDGGHILMSLIELIRRKKLGFKAQEIFQNIGFGALILLMIVVFYNDFVNFGIFTKIASFFK